MRQLSTSFALIACASVLMYCSQAKDNAPVKPYDLKATVPTGEMAAPRGWQPYRGVIHLHSVYSHDACDELGFVNAEGKQDYEHGSMNVACFRELRKSLCDIGEDWVFLTDHNAHMSEFDWNKLLLYDPEAGDRLIEKDGVAWVNDIACPNGHHVLLSAGIDYDLIAIGLQGHVAPTYDERQNVYGKRTPEAIAALKQKGAIATAGYIPRWDEEQLFSLPFDAMEIYNPVFNMKERLADVLQYVLEKDANPDAWPHPELVIAGVFEENQRALSLWSRMVQMKRMPTYVGPNAHQNTVPQQQTDGERLDSYRRMLHWFTNYATIHKDQPLTMEAVKEAVLAGHMYQAFEYLGTPTGFDFYANAGATTFEMGAEVPKGMAVTLHVAAPTVAGLPATDKQPEVSVRIVKAAAPAQWVEVKRGSGEITFEATEPGVYRAEARIVPHHLEKLFGSDPTPYMHEMLWIYSNAIYVGMDYTK
jgi:hypothetical protein